MDPGAYGPTLSFTLLVAVLVGGATSSLGPVAGVLALGGLSLLADLIGRITDADLVRFGPFLAAMLLLAVLSLGAEGIVPSAASRVRRSVLTGRLVRARRRSLEPRSRRGAWPSASAALVALSELDLELQPARTFALIGPNGSGKTTALRLLSGTLVPDTGELSLDGSPPEGARHRRPRSARRHSHAAIGRSLPEPDRAGECARRRLAQAPACGPVAGPRRDTEGPRGMPTPPAARSPRSVDLESRAHELAATLSGPEQRLLMIASALATEPRVLLIDEPAAGAGQPELERLVGILRRPQRRRARVARRRAQPPPGPLDRRPGARAGRGLPPCLGDTGRRGARPAVSGRRTSADNGSDLQLDCRTVRRLAALPDRSVACRRLWWR